MPASVIWRRRAENHLQAIYDYISLENPHAASAYAEDIVAASERLRTFRVENSTAATECLSSGTI